MRPLRPNLSATSLIRDTKKSMGHGRKVIEKPSLFHWLYHRFPLRYYRKPDTSRTETHSPKRNLQSRSAAGLVQSCGIICHWFKGCGLSTPLRVESYFIRFILVERLTIRHFQDRNLLTLWFRYVHGVNDTSCGVKVKTEVDEWDIILLSFLSLFQ